MKPYANNPRLHSEADLDQIRASVLGMRRPIANNSRPGRAIYDPFLVLGTSLIAAEMTGRMCCGLELNPAFVDVIVRRWQVLTGPTARHQASGQSVDERADRQNPDPSGTANG